MIRLLRTAIYWMRYDFMCETSFCSCWGIHRPWTINDVRIIQFLADADPDVTILWEITNIHKINVSGWTNRLISLITPCKSVPNFAIFVEIVWNVILAGARERNWWWFITPTGSDCKLWSISPKGTRPSELKFHVCANF